MNSARVYAISAAMGAVAGLRSFTAPAVIAWTANRGNLGLKRTALGFLRSGAARNAFAGLAAGEWIPDKIPGIPDRVTTGPLIARAASGGFCGAAVSAAKRKNVVVGAVLGGAAAVGASFAAYHLRRCAPGTTAAIVEDAIAVGAGAAALSAVA